MNTWRPASGYQSKKDNATLWRAVRTDGVGRLIEHNKRDGNLWTCRSQEAARRKCDELNATQGDFQ